MTLKNEYRGCFHYKQITSLVIHFVVCFFNPERERKIVENYKTKTYCSRYPWNSIESLYSFHRQHHLPSLNSRQSQCQRLRLRQIDTLSGKGIKWKHFKPFRANSHFFPRSAKIIARMVPNPLSVGKGLLPTLWALERYCS